MAALTATQISWLRGKVGSSPDDAALNALYAELGSLADVARQVLSERLANMAAAPAQFNVEGAYSQSTAENLRTVRAQLNDPELYDPDDDQPGEVRIIPPAPRPRR